MRRLVIGAFMTLSAGMSAVADSTNALDRTWSYVVADGKATITGVSPNTGKLSIPQMLGEYPVTAIGNSAFCWSGGLVSVTVPQGVTRIGDLAFEGCRGLETVQLSASVSNLGARVFSQCGGLTRIVVDAGNPKYSSQNGLLCSKDGKTLVQGVNGAVTVPESVTRIADAAFYGCDGLISLKLPANLDSIADNAFELCSGLISITVDEKNAKYRSQNGLLCSKDGTTLIRGVNGEVSIPTNVTSIAASAFSSCPGLKEVTIPPGVTNIGKRAFASCVALVSATVPEGVSNLVAGVFADCRSLETVTLPSGMRRIDLSAFDGCVGLVSFTVTETNRFYRSQNGLLCSGDGTTVLKGVNGDVTIPTNVTRIADAAFYGCAGLVSVTIPTNVTSIGRKAFDGTPFYEGRPDGLLVFGRIAYGVKGDCPPLVIVPGEATIFGELAFEDCEGLSAVMIPPGVTRIGDGAFDGCGGLSAVYVAGEEEIARVRGLYDWSEGVEILALAVHASVLGEKVSIDTGLTCYAADGLPPGLSYGARTGLVTGAGKAVGEYLVTFAKPDAPTEMALIVIEEEEVVIDRDALAAAIPGAGLNGSAAIKAVAAVTGVKSISVSGQPPGMKFDKKTSSLVGVPSKSGAFTLSVKVTTAGGTKKAVEVPVNVAALPDMAVGKFDGFLRRTDADGSAVCGTIAFTSTDAGKLTAKVTTSSGTCSLKATGWDSSVDGTYFAKLSTKKGESLELSLDSNAAWNACQLVGTFVADGTGYGVAAQRKAFGTPWYFTATGDMTNGWTLAYAPNAKSAALTVAVKSDGSTSLSGKLGGTKIKASGSLDVSGRKDGVLFADFVQVLSVKSGKKTVKRPLFVRANLWFDRRSDHEGGVGSAKFSE